MADKPTEASGGLTKEIWEGHITGAAVVEPKELCRLIYFGGLASSIRREVWPYLLNHYKWCTTTDERESWDAVMRVTYEHSVSEWMAVEAIIRQRDKEAFAASVAKVTNQNSSDIPLVGKDSSLRYGENRTCRWQISSQRRTGGPLCGMKVRSQTFREPG